MPLRELVVALVELERDLSSLHEKRYQDLNQTSIKVQRYISRLFRVFGSDRSVAANQANSYIERVFRELAGRSNTSFKAIQHRMATVSLHIDALEDELQDLQMRFGGNVDSPAYADALKAFVGHLSPADDNSH